MLLVRPLEYRCIENGRHQESRVSLAWRKTNLGCPELELLLPSMLMWNHRQATGCEHRQKTCKLSHSNILAAFL